MGNHDYGDADSDSGDGPAASRIGRARHRCEKQVFAAVHVLYTSPNDDRWILEDHFMSTPLRTQILVWIAIFNVTLATLILTARCRLDAN
ncbi:hypothetical protein GQ600_6050 [Phytophthora cactorum]|nr:hypothetical protein GQ600_6050 [Phytophthora cactorum]